MKIYDKDPKTWQDLQDLVGQMFAETGCTVEISKTIQLVRGQKEIDVYVEDATSTPHSKYLCECKFWKSAIPQEVVHAFRTVVADFGAHRGFIVSKVGFQAGSREAAKNTNIELLTFDELQELFFTRWLSSIVLKYMPYADRLFPYWDPSGGRMPKSKWTDIDLKHHRLLIDVYAPLVDLGPGDVMTGFQRKFPIELPKINDLYEVEGTIFISSHRQYFDFIDANKDDALRRFQVLYGEQKGQPSAADGQVAAP
jgi:hypothetical protein